MTAVPDMPLTVPVKVPESWALYVSSGWIISRPIAIRVPVRKPQRVCVSMAVMMVLPSAWLMLVMGTVAVNLPVADAGVDALTMGTRSIRESSSGIRSFKVFFVRVSWTNVLLFMTLSLRGLDLVVR